MIGNRCTLVATVLEQALTLEERKLVEERAISFVRSAGHGGHAGTGGHGRVGRTRGRVRCAAGRGRVQTKETEAAAEEEEEEEDEEDEDDEEEDEDESADEYELETIVAIQRSLGSDSRRSRADRRRGPCARAVADTDEEVEFADMTEKELRFRKYAEFKTQWASLWEAANSRIVPNALSYLFQEQAQQWAESHLNKRQVEKKRRIS